MLLSRSFARSNTSTGSVAGRLHGEALEGCTQVQPQLRPSKSPRQGVGALGFGANAEAIPSSRSKPWLQVELGARRLKTAFRAMDGSAYLNSQMQLLKASRPLASFMSNDGIRYEVTRNSVGNPLDASQDHSIGHCISKLLIIHAEM